MRILADQKNLARRKSAACVEAIDDVHRRAVIDRETDHAQRLEVRRQKIARRGLDDVRGGGVREAVARRVSPPDSALETGDTVLASGPDAAARIDEQPAEGFVRGAVRNCDPREVILIRCLAKKSAAARGGPQRAVAVADEFEDRAAGD